MLAYLTAACPLAPDVSLTWLATQTAGLLPGDLRALVADAQAEAAMRTWRAATAAGTLPAPAALAAAGPTILAADFQRALNRAQGAQAAAIGAPKVRS